MVMTLSVGLLNLTDIFNSSVLSVNWDSITGRAIRYGLNAPGIETRWERDFPHPSKPSLEPTQLLYIGYRIFFRGIMRPGRDIDHPPTFSAEIKERVNIYLSSPSRPLWSVLRWVLNSVISLHTHTHSHTHTLTYAHWSERSERLKCRKKPVFCPLWSTGYVTLFVLHMYLLNQVNGVQWSVLEKLTHI
jgi:hypothetical protein